MEKEQRSSLIFFFRRFYALFEWAANPQRENEGARKTKSRVFAPKDLGLAAAACSFPTLKNKLDHAPAHFLWPRRQWGHKISGNN